MINMGGGVKQEKNFSLENGNKNNLESPGYIGITYVSKVAEKDWFISILPSLFMKKVPQSCFYFMNYKTHDKSWRMEMY